MDREQSIQLEVDCDGMSIEVAIKSRVAQDETGSNALKALVGSRHLPRAMPVLSQSLASTFLLLQSVETSFSSIFRSRELRYTVFELLDSPLIIFFTDSSAELALQDLYGSSHI